jgi:hypothetical protein
VEWSGVGRSGTAGQWDIWHLSCEGSDASGVTGSEWNW